MIAELVRHSVAEDDLFRVCGKRMRRPSWAARSEDRRGEGEGADSATPRGADSAPLGAGCHYGLHSTVKDCSFEAWRVGLSV